MKPKNIVLLGCTGSIGVSYAEGGGGACCKAVVALDYE
jgi:hypothetical protein